MASTGTRSKKKWRLACRDDGLLHSAAQRQQTLIGRA